MTLLYDPDYVVEIIEPETTDQQGNRSVTYVDTTDKLVTVIEYADGSRSYTARPIKGF